MTDGKTKLRFKGNSHEDISSYLSAIAAELSRKELLTSVQGGVLTPDGDAHNALAELLSSICGRSQPAEDIPHAAGLTPAQVREEEERLRREAAAKTELTKKRNDSVAAIIDFLDVGPCMIVQPVYGSPAAMLKKLIGHDKHTSPNTVFLTMRRLYSMKHRSGQPVCTKAPDRQGRPPLSWHRYLGE